LETTTGIQKKLNLKRKSKIAEEEKITNRISSISDDFSANDIITNICGDNVFAANLFKYNPNSIAIFDLDGYYVTGNDAFRELFGEVPPKDYSLYNDPILIEENLIGQINRVKSGEIVDVSSAIWYDPKKVKPGIDAKKVFISAIGIPARDTSGQVEYIAILHKNKTIQKDAELKINNVNSAFMQERSLFNSGPVVIFKWKNESGSPVEYVSPNVTETLGYTPDDFLAYKTKFFTLIYDDDKERVNTEVKKHSKDGIASFNHDPYRVCRKDGKVIWVDDYTTILRDETGCITHYLGYIIDITDRIEAVQALMKSGKKYRELVEKAGIAILIDDIKGNFTYFNDTFTNIFGYTRTEMKKKKLTDLVHLDDLDEGNELHRKRAKANLKSCNYEFRGIKKDDSEIYLNVDFSALKENGKITGWRSYITDITLKKHIEQDLRFSHEQLEANVYERTMQLNQVVEELSSKHEALAQKNIALEEVLCQIDDSKKQMALQIQSYIQKIAYPILDSIREGASESDERRLSILKSTLAEITSPFISLLDIQFPMLTPREIEVCNMVKNGFSCKEIASSLNISVQTVLKQRKAIRKKLGISNKKINLTSYLKLLR
jgi:PAS domain S-box-containing protein